MSSHHGFFLLFLLLDRLEIDILGLNLADSVFIADKILVRIFVIKSTIVLSQFNSSLATVNFSFSSTLLVYVRLLDGVCFKCFTKLGFLSMSS